MPDTISFDSETFRFVIEDPSGNAAHIGLVDFDDNTVTLMVLGKNASTISGNYTLKILSDDETDPSELSESGPIAFLAEV